MTYKAIDTYAKRVFLDNRCTDTVLYVHDWVTASVVATGGLTVLYKIFWAVLNIIQYMFITTGVQDLIIYRVDNVWTDPMLAEEPLFWMEYVSFVWNFLFRPSVLTLLFDLPLMYALIMTQQWGIATYLALFWFVNLILVTVVYPIFPAMDVPALPFPTLFGGPSNLYNE